MPRGRESTSHYKVAIEEIYTWVAKSPTTNLAARCTYCKCEINLSSVGKSALDSHAKSRKHQSEVENRKKSVPMDIFIKPQLPKSNSDSSAPKPATSALKDAGVSYESAGKYPLRL